MKFTIGNSSEQVVEDEEYDEAINFDGNEHKRGASDYIHGLVKRKGNDFYIVLLSDNNTPCSSKHDLSQSHRQELERFLKNEFTVNRIIYNL